MFRRKAVVIGILAVAVCLAAVSAIYVAFRRKSQAGVSAVSVAVPGESQASSPDDSEIKHLMAAAKQVGRPGNNPALDRLKAKWRSRHNAGLAEPDELRAWLNFCRKLHDRAGAAEWARAIWDVVVVKPPAASVRLSDIREVLRLNGSPRLPGHPWSARIHEVLTSRLSQADMSVSELKEWLAFRCEIRSRRADDSEAGALLDVLSTVADILRGTRGMHVAQVRLTDETGMVNLPAAKVLAWVHWRNDSGRRYRDNLELRRFVGRLEEIERNDLRGDAAAMCRLAIAYGTSMITVRGRRRMSSGDYRIAIAATQSDDMLLLCLEEIASMARATASYDYALSVLDTATVRLSGEGQRRARALQQELSELKSKLPPKSVRKR